MNLTPASATCSSHLGFALAQGIALAVLLAAVYVVYLPGLGGPFLLDDQQIVRYQVDDLSWNNLRLAAQNNARFNGLSRFLSHASFALSNYASGISSAILKRQNLLLHLANALLVYWLTLVLLRREKSLNSYIFTVPLAVAAAWALHPLHVSTTLYVVQRLVLLATFFSLLTLIAFLSGRSRLARRPAWGTVVALSGFSIFFSLGFLSKEIIALIPIQLALIEFFFFRSERLSPKARAFRRFVLITLIVLPFIAAVTAFGLHWNEFMGGYQGRNFTLYERLLTQIHALGLYIQQFFYPVPASMTLFHDGFPVQRSLDVKTLVLASAFLGMTLVSFKLRKSAPLVGFGWTYFLTCHLLESTFIPLELVFEHRNYLAFFGLALMVSGAILKLDQWFHLGRLCGVGALLIITLLGLNTAARAYAWSDAELLYKTDALSHPNSRRIQEALFKIATLRDNHEQALIHLDRLRVLRPDSASPDLLELTLLCPEAPSSRTQELKDRALRQLPTGPLEVIEINMVGSLLSRVRDDQCPALTRYDVFALSEAVIQNRNVHTPNSRLGALARGITAAAMIGDSSRVRRYAKEALSLARAKSPAQFDDMTYVVTSHFARYFEEELPEILVWIGQTHGNYMKHNGISLRVTRKNAEAADALLRQLPLAE